MNKTKLLLGVAFGVMVVAELLQLPRPRQTSSPLTQGEASHIFGGQAGTCYQTAPTDCPSSVGLFDCPDCSLQQFTCDENGVQATYTSYFCANDDSDYNLASNSDTYQSAVDMGANATNGNTGEKQTGTQNCGDIFYCATSSQNPTCADRTTPCTQDGDVWFCGILSQYPLEELVYSPDATTPACPPPVGSLKRRVPTSLMAAAINNGVYYALQAQ